MRNDGQLAGDDRRAPPSAVVDHLEQVGPRQRRESAREAAVAVQDAQLLAQARHAQVQRRVRAPAGVGG